MLFQIDWVKHWRAAQIIIKNKAIEGDIRSSKGGRGDVLGRPRGHLPLYFPSQLFGQKKKLLVLLRDGRKLVGVLRSFDQFANVVLENALERVIVGDLYCDLPLGLYVIRGKNVVLIGELDLDRKELPTHMSQVSATDIKQAQKAERDATELKGSMRKRMEFLDLE